MGTESTNSVKTFLSFWHLFAFFFFFSPSIYLPFWCLNLSKCTYHCSRNFLVWYFLAFITISSITFKNSWVRTFTHINVIPNQSSASYKVKVKVKVIQSCSILWDSMAYIVHEILQARILEWVAVPFSRGSSQSRDGTQVSGIAGRFFTSWATMEAHPTRWAPSKHFKIKCDENNFPEYIL